MDAQNKTIRARQGLGDTFVPLPEDEHWEDVYCSDTEAEDEDEDENEATTTTRKWKDAWRRPSAENYRPELDGLEQCALNHMLPSSYCLRERTEVKERLRQICLQEEQASDDDDVLVDQ